MHSRLTAKPAHEVIAAIQALDLESVKLRVMDAELGEGWTREHADRIELAYKNYLIMLTKYQEHAEDILLSQDVDEFWHTHILQTRKYTEDCERVFGAFLHHEPHVGARTAADLEKRSVLAEKTRELYQREFGSARVAAAAWVGGTTKTAGAAYSTVSIGARNAAYSTASIRAGGAAYSTASIHAENAAYSTASIRAGNAAYSTASIRAGDAAYSTASIRAENAAYSTASIRAENAAYSTASIRPPEPAFSGATQ